MAVVIPGTLPRDVGGGQTGAQRAAGFAAVQTSGIRDLARELLRLATRAGSEATPLLEKAAIEASKPIRDRYKKSINDVTGNLAASVSTRKSRGQKLPGIGTAITGPVHRKSGTDWDVAQGRSRKPSGNHAWLLEFGTGRRRPGTRGRRTYVRVHEKINKSFIKRNDLGTVTDETFAKMGRGFYFIMGSKNEPTRQAKRGSGYPHDFGPFALGANETYRGITAQHPMENAIRAASPEVLSRLTKAIQSQVLRLGG